MLLAVKWSACRIYGCNMDEAQLSTLRSRLLDDSRLLLLLDKGSGLQTNEGLRLSESMTRD